MKTNCWDFTDCGRAPGGPKEEELGKCPAATYVAFRGVNGGFFSGRYCWYVAGTLQKGKPQCIYLSDVQDCLACKFLKLVRKEEGPNFQM